MGCSDTMPLKTVQITHPGDVISHDRIPYVSKTPLTSFLTVEEKLKPVFPKSKHVHSFCSTLPG